ncbi:uncharacterized protein F5147DRAFT_656229 [Suillus discolor]|uniref:Uncharacterized protein n=1 Tax=Suillus discolor TaxID=1912936 RepID=A0A9P7EZ13_9AGAM|nr:uncharacterized protein F5147DRAFT_656229 [Suillus discolor]KAG2097994.1 hypothetical protein F5147DRAFT_656229 [Suillus discolor]
MGVAGCGNSEIWWLCTTAPHQRILLIKYTYSIVHDTPPEFDEWALSGLTKEKCVQNKSLARQGKREAISFQAEPAHITHPVAGEHNSTLILAHVKYFHVPSLAVAVVLFALLQILVHTDLGHHDTSALADPHMGSISLGACQRLSPFFIPCGQREFEHSYTKVLQINVYVRRRQTSKFSLSKACPRGA